LGNWEIGKLGNWEIGKLGNWEIGKLPIINYPQYSMLISFDFPIRLKPLKTAMNE
jgi:hypothetical protein